MSIYISVILPLLSNTWIGLFLVATTPHSVCFLQWLIRMDMALPVHWCGIDTPSPGMGSANLMYLMPPEKVSYFSEAWSFFT